MVRRHSFLSTVQEIINWSESSDVTKIGIVGRPDTGKSTLAESIAHFVHKRSKIPFAVRIFTKEHLINFRATFYNLKPTNYILVFDDISFLGADANRKQVEMIKQAETTIRHMPGGEDVKIILIYNYHYVKGLDKYLRQADFYYFTSIGSEEQENTLGIVGKKYVKNVEQFKRYVVSAKSRKYWQMIIGPKEPFIYRYRNPFIPVLFWNNESLRFIVSPKRQWIDPQCGTCEIGMKESTESDNLKIEEIVKKGEVNYGVGNFKGAIKMKLFINGMTVHGIKVVRAMKYIDKMLLSGATIEGLAEHYGFEVTQLRRKKKKEELPDA